MTDTNKVYYDGPMYKVVEGKGVGKDIVDRDVYKVINKSNNFIEEEFTVLPQAIIIAKDFDKAMEQLNNEEAIELAKGLVIN